MTMKYPTAILSALCVAGACRAALEFSACRNIANEASFVITDLDERKSSGWITVGQTFAGYTLVAFDSETETLSVRKGDLKLDLHLNDAQVQKDEAPPPALAERHQSYIARWFGGNANVAVVELRFEKESVYITAKEVWKGTDYPVGVTFKAPRNSILGDTTPLEDGVAAKVISGPSLSKVLAGHDTRTIAGTDGVKVAGPTGLSLEEFRAYFQKNAGGAGGQNSDANLRAERTGKEPNQSRQPTRPAGG